MSEVNTQEVVFPRLGGASSAFYRALSSGPHLARCEECGHEFYYPRPVCPRCLAEAVNLFPVEDDVRIVSFTHVHRVQSQVFMTGVPQLMLTVSHCECLLILAGDGWDESGPTIGQSARLAVQQRSDGSLAMVAVPA